MSRYPPNQGNRSTSGNGWSNRANVGPGPRPQWKPKQKVDLDGSLGTASSSQKVDSSASAECISGNAPSSTPKPDSDIHLQEEPPLPPVKNAASGMENLKQMPDSSQRADNHSKQLKSVSNSDYGSKDLKHMNPITRKSQQGRVSDGYFTPTKRIPGSFSPMQNGIPEKGKQSVDQDNSGKLEDTDHPSSITPFDICPIKANSFVKVKPPLHALNREKRNQLKHSLEGPNIEVLRPGMVLMKGYISPEDQVNIVKTCRDLGIGDGGFYQPGYRDGAKLHLRMMCLGMDWDPQSSKYNGTRQFDNSKPPEIPDKFREMVKRALQVLNAHIQKNKGKMIPEMSPDICIVNFYSKSGKLGLHQDKDESRESLDRGLPVVSFSIGGSAKFLYGMERDVEKAEEVVLESGDVLIFGGESRHIFHGVSSVDSDSAPATLLEATNMRAGRLNLTFRQNLVGNRDIYFIV